MLARNLPLLRQQQQQHLQQHPTLAAEPVETLFEIGYVTYVMTRIMSNVPAVHSHAMRMVAEQLQPFKDCGCSATLEELRQQAHGVKSSISVVFTA